MALPQNPAGMMAGMNPTAGLSEQEVQMTKMIQATMESCAGKTVMAGVMGGGLGAMFGLFMASMRYDTPMGQPLATANPSPVAAGAAATQTPKPATTPIANAARAAAASASPQNLPSTAAAHAVSATATAPAPAPAASLLSPAAAPIADLPLKQQLKHGLRDMYRSSLSSGKNFAKVGAIFSGTECAIEGLRAKNDLYNGVAGGCITGGVLARAAGPQAVAVGCAGFAVFSAAIDAYMRMPEDERSKPIA
ncbi:mitochondrial inner membrane translocase subunit Tim17/Tim22/Tim23/peroxisomal protein PMP24 [Boeremia exigua]|uniref:mitochondrial inner membrane translocase subunit Tim17/Tim22/Tim23/peroxisomal protein PMP24 n=1 Tax=Boeremia exigua TaxID=749465 RepID=UPI001E8CF1CF|nr:mitochondrial inner membrane translocase subunit Tim17/Tim22/Tim23/peroxisomal protein PMP24 [Boeremia exigua]KAH6638867.1 mitochondrial inner membrane translocase subunit Tim17/Tim22/Tim23/peroxisomal protein PMP24 [Boeremia exigua]